MTPFEIADLRLVNQRLIRPGFEKPEQVVRFLGAVQAQDYAGAKWAIAQRMRRAVDAHIEQAFDRGDILRTHILRPTWHFVTPADVRWMLDLTAPRVKAATASYFRKMELDDATIRRSHDALSKVLEGGRQLMRDELRKAVARAGIDVSNALRFSFLILRAELDALICSGPRRGKQFTYALLDERVPATPSITREEALSELARRYFSTRGPATVYDFSWWSGLTIADVRRGLDMLKSELEQRAIDGNIYWFSPASPARRRSNSPRTYLLPNYDEYFIGLKDRSAFGERLRANGVRASSDALSAHIVIIDGQIVGGWKRTLLKDSVAVHLTLIAPLTDVEQQSITEAAERYGRFLDTTVSVE